LPGLLERLSSASVARADGHSMGCGGNCQLGILLPIKVRGETFSACTLDGQSRRSFTLAPVDLSSFSAISADFLCDLCDLRFSSNESVKRKS
jgi:hypothetical protein